MKELKIYAYTMTHDTGFAPAVHGKELSLGCCKTFLRHKIAEEWGKLKDTTDFYVIGICGKQLADRNKKTNQETSDYYPIYIAKVKKVIKAIEYYKDQKDFKRTDTQYSYRDGEWLYSEYNPHHILTNGNKSKYKGWRILPNPENEKDINYINRKNKDENYILVCETTTNIN